MTKKTVGIDEAAGILGLSKEALRKRIKRGSIEAVKDQAGRWQVTVEATGQATSPDASRTLIDQLRSENEFLRQQLHQQSIIIYNLSESVNLLEAPARRPWWRRIFKRRNGDNKMLD